MRYLGMALDRWMILYASCFFTLMESDMMIGVCRDHCNNLLFLDLSGSRQKTLFSQCIVNSLSSTHSNGYMVSEYLTRTTYGVVCSRKFGDFCGGLVGGEEVILNILEQKLHYCATSWILPVIIDFPIRLKYYLSFIGDIWCHRISKANILSSHIKCFRSIPFITYQSSISF